MNQWTTLRNSEAGSNLADMGRCAVRDIPGFVTGVSTPKPCISGGEEATVKACGVTVGDAAGVELGASLIDRSRGERGNHSTVAR